MDRLTDLLTRDLDPRVGLAVIVAFAALLLLLALSL